MSKFYRLIVNFKFSTKKQHDCLVFIFNDQFFLPFLERMRLEIQCDGT